MHSTALHHLGESCYRSLGNVPNVEGRPGVLRPEYPTVDRVDLPWLWSLDDVVELCRRLEQLREGGDV